MKNISLLFVFILSISMIIACDVESQDTDVIALINDEKEITFNELNNYHSSRFFERRFPDADLRAYPLALNEMVIKEKKLIDFFEQGFHKDSLLMLDIQRTINEELVQIYFNEIYFKEFIDSVDASGSAEELRNRFLDRALMSFDEKKDEMINGENVEWNDNALIQITEWAKVENFFNENSPRYRTILNEAVAEGYNPVIMKYAEDSINVEQYHKLLNEVLVMGNTSSLDVTMMKEFLLEAVRTNGIIKKAKEYDIHKDLVSKRTPSKILESRFITLYNRKMIFEPIPEPNQNNLMEFYEQEKEGKLYRQAKRILYVSLYKDESNAQQKWEEHQQGKTFEELTNRSWLVKSFIKDQNDNIQSYLSNEEPYLGEQAFSMQQGDVAGPILVEVPGEGEMYAIVKCNAANEAEIPDFDEVDNIEEKFMEYHRLNNEKEIEERLRNEYEMKVYDENLKAKIT